ncbi:MAG: SpoIID/LytB domain-containing protein, partial [cyanobacterium endosymbiont of Rhopalodia yunnanensis]
MSQKHDLDYRVWTFKLLQILLGRYGWLIGIIWMILSFPAQGATELRVAIEKSVGTIKVGSSTLAIVRDGSGRKLGELT